MMASAKDIRLEPIASRQSREFICKHHYSGKCPMNSQMHIGVFLNGKLLGAMAFGPPLDRRKVLGLVRDTEWNGMVELNRMVFLDELPRNSESRAIGIACRQLKKHAPQLEWILSFADGSQCGDGTIYRASGFLLTHIRPTQDLARLKSGEVVHSMTLKSSPNSPRPELGGRTFFDVSDGFLSFTRYCKAANAEILKGFQLRYIKPLNGTVLGRLTVPVIPFSEIEKRGASMYMGEQITR